VNPQLVPTARLARLSLRIHGDDRLAELVGQGSEAAFEAIVHRYRRALVRHCEQVVGDSDADEAVQEALLKAHRALARGTPVRRLGPWLHAIAHNSALAMLATRRARAEYREDDGAAEGFTGPSDQLRREHLDALMAALGSLPARQRRALVMRELEGRSYEEIAVRLGASDGAVRQLLSRARASIRQRLGALIPVELVTRWMTIAGGPGSSRAWTFAGSGALVAKLSGAILMSAAPVVAVAPAPAAAIAVAQVPAHREANVAVPHVTGRVSRSAPALREAPAAVRPEVDQERQHHEEPLEPGHVVTGAPRPERGVRERGPGQQEEPEHRQDPAVEGVTQDAAKDPQQDQYQPWRDQREQREQAGHGVSVVATSRPVVTQTG
jgi:RNA polymerase sigma factor (sigma-70 family)